MNDCCLAVIATATGKSGAAAQKAPRSFALNASRASSSAKAFGARWEHEAPREAAKPVVRGPDLDLESNRVRVPCLQGAPEGRPLHGRTAARCQGEDCGLIYEA